MSQAALEHDLELIQTGCAAESMRGGKERDKSMKWHMKSKRPNERTDLH